MGISKIIKKNILEPAFGLINQIVKIDRSKASKEKWEKEAQKGEFEFHKGNKWRNSPRFMQDTILLFDSFGFSRDQYKGKTVLDLGAGSKLRCKYFQGAKLIAIEPMADDCVREIPWTDLTDAEGLYSIPAEEFVPELEEQVDFLFSVNVLDHCFDFKDILKNIHRYLKPDGLAFLSFDVHFVTDEMHPLILTDKVCIEIFEETGFKIQKKNRGFFGKYKEAKKTDTYGHGSYCLNYWLTKN
ncbi:MAG: class I SAM-dependent methyltransferase [Saprospiraceae bacterium]